MFSIGIQEIIVILIVIVLLVDYRKIPEFARGVGKIYREIKSAQDNIKNEILRPGDDDNQIEGTSHDSVKSKKNQDDGSYNGSGRAG